MKLGFFVIDTIIVYDEVCMCVTQSFAKSIGVVATVAVLRRPALCVFLEPVSDLPSKFVPDKVHFILLHISQR